MSALTIDWKGLRPAEAAEAFGSFGGAEGRAELHEPGFVNH